MILYRLYIDFIYKKSRNFGRPNIDLIDQKYRSSGSIVHI